MASTLSSVVSFPAAPEGVFSLAVPPDAPIEQVDDVIDASAVARVAATLGLPAPAAGEPLPALWHWAFFQQMVPESLLGPDGHPSQAGLLPPRGGRNRMWAGGRLRFLAPLRVQVPASRRSSVVAVQEKTGRTGVLTFFTVRHEYWQDGALMVGEEQDIVYRDPTPPKLGAGEPVPQAEWQAPVLPTEALLFRYSAVTFNTHRIHYDHPYVTQTEGYPGLVVHGPLIATQMMQAFTQAHPQARVTHLAYRGLRPLIAPHSFVAAGRITAPGTADLWAANADGLAHRAELRFTPA